MVTPVLGRYRVTALRNERKLLAMERLAAILIVLIVASAPSLAGKKTYITFQATVLRIEPWGLAKIPCGVAVNYRLAEYSVSVPYEGNLTRGKKLVLKHLACNYTELDDLHPGEKVLVVAEVLGRVEMVMWNRGLESSKKSADERLNVAYLGVSVGKLVYPTADWPQ
jgi:hypothetical protein